MDFIIVIFHSVDKVGSMSHSSWTQLPVNNEGRGDDSGVGFLTPSVRAPECGILGCSSDPTPSPTILNIRRMNQQMEMSVYVLK